ncbi:MAG: hypothetical protein U0X92_10645 [Anaerolineales bacterium]
MISILLNVADDVFDNPVDESLAREFLADPRHHIVVALVDGTDISRLPFTTFTLISRPSCGSTKSASRRHIKRANAVLTAKRSLNVGKGSPAVSTHGC